jgi:hypothetical protein
VKNRFSHSRCLGAFAITVLALLAVAPASRTASSSTVRTEAVAATVASCLSLVPPAYGPTVWTGISAPHKGPADVIADWGGTTNDPSSGGGPGGAFSRANDNSIMAAEGNGVTVLGYVWSDYANSSSAYPSAPVSEVEAQVRTWKAWYGVTDIFVDGATVGTGQGQIKYYSQIYKYIHSLSPGASVWVNPGFYPSSSYLGVADVIVDWENSSLPTSPPSWVLKYPASRFANIIHGYAGSVSMALAVIRGDHAQYAYVTSSGNYSALPNYWSTEQADACSPARHR